MALLHCNFHYCLRSHFFHYGIPPLARSAHHQIQRYCLTSLTSPIIRVLSRLSRRKQRSIQYSLRSFSINIIDSQIEKQGFYPSIVISQNYEFSISLHNIIILMNRRQIALSPSQQQYQIQSNGCFFQNQSSTTPSKIRVYSQSKGIKEKKIDLVSKKRFFSHQKQKQTEGRMVSKSPRKMGEVYFSQTQSSEKNSIKNSKISFNNDLQILRPAQQYKSQTLSTKATYPYLPQNTTHQIYPTPNTIISQISIVSQQFISQGSATLNILNILTPPTTNHSSSIGSPFSRQKGGANNPLQRLMDRKRYDRKLDNLKKKLIL